MANLTQVGLTAGVPTSGTGTVSTLDAMMADGGQTTIGAIADAAVITDANGTVSAKLRGLVKLVAAAVAGGAGSLFSKITDGTNTAAVKGASAAPVATDPALVVAISPNSVNPNGQNTMANSAPVVIASNQSAIPVTVSGSGPVTNLWAPGTSNNGLIASLLTLESTELNALASAAVAPSTVGGTSGLFTNVNTGQAIQGEVFLTLGAIGSALTAGANIAGWFLQSPDGGTTIESTTVAPARSPDFIVPLPATTIGAGAVFKANNPVLLPALNFKVLAQNNTGQALAATANTIKVAPTAQQV